MVDRICLEHPQRHTFEASDYVTDKLCVVCMVPMTLHSAGYIHSQICSLILQSHFTELASKKFGRQASFQSAGRNGAQLFPLGFELLEFIGLAARKNETNIFSLVYDSKAEVLEFLF